MAGQKLTDITEKSSGFSLSDLFHLVDVDNTAQDPAGSSFKVAIGNVLKEWTWIKIGTAVVLKGTGTSTTAIQDGDWVIYMTDTRLVIGKALATVTVIGDYDDPAKFAKFIDNSPLL